MTLNHHRLPARSGDTRSIVVLLHGFGANGAAMLGLAQALSITLPDTAFVAPDAPDPAPGRPGARMWYTIPELDGSSVDDADARLQVSAELLAAFLDDQLAETGLPASAMALLGFSQGAGLCYEVGPRRQNQLGGVIAIAGRMKRKQVLAGEVRTRPPFLILTGAEDRLLATDELATTTAALTGANIPVQHVTMPGVGHGISQAGINAASDFLRRVVHQPG